MANDQKHLLVIARLIAGALIGGGDAAAGQAMTTPLERAISTPRGQLRTPYPDFANVAAEGLEIYRSHDCNGCHGGGGGGGMAAPLTNQSAVKVPTIRRSLSCKRSQRSVWT
jgi:mono/diheme cytochrome c family protein